MAIRMIVTDLDGTLLNSANTISDKNIQAFKKAISLGIIPVVATGRIDSEAFFFARSIGATDYLISGNGGVVKDYQNKRLIHQVDLEWSTVREFLNLFKGYDEIFCQAHTALGCICTENTFPWMENAGWAKAYVKEFRDKQIVVKDIEEYVAGKKIGINKFVLSSVNFSLLDDIMEKAGKLNGMEVLRPMDYCVECIPTGVDKGFGLIMLCDYLGIELEDVMVIGDSDNDKEMFEVHGPVKVAMGNAFDSIKELAAHIVSSNDEDGVAEAIEAIIFKTINNKEGKA